MADIDRTTEIDVTGMTCNHCVKHVTDQLNQVEGVKNVFVVLDPKGTSTVTVLSDFEIPEEELRRAVSEAGYEAHDIRRDS